MLDFLCGSDQTITLAHSKGIGGAWWASYMSRMLFQSTWELTSHPSFSDSPGT